jgi:hypothetical protein
MTNGQQVNCLKNKGLDSRPREAASMGRVASRLLIFRPVPGKGWFSLAGDIRIKVSGERGREMGKAAPKSESDVILMAIAQEKESYAQLAAAACGCTCQKARRLYNQLALDELRHLLTLVSLMDGLADDCLT